MVLLVPLDPSPSEATLGLEVSVPTSPVKVPRHVPDPKEEAYQIRDIPLKGKGVFATRNISCGEVIIREKPLIVMPKKIFDDDDPDYIELWLDRQINRLSSEDRELFYSLSDSRFSDGEGNTTLGIFYTNDMTFTDDSAALCPTIARVNHSCVPNSDFIARDNLGVQDLVATTAIRKNEEITICYLPSSGAGSDLRKTRQTYTRQWYGFQCICQACTAQGKVFRCDERLRMKAKNYQAVPFEELSLLQVDDFVDCLRKIGAKLPYMIEILHLAIEKALKMKDPILMAKFSSLAYTSASIILESDEKDLNPFQFMLESKMVTIGDHSYLFQL